MMNLSRESRSGARLVREALGTGSGGSRPVRLRYKSMGPDHLVCRAWDGTSEGSTDVLVAKPYLLRRTPFDGQSRGGFSYTYSADDARVSTDGSTTESQVIVPSYVVNDELYAIAAGRGGTGVDDAPTYLDLNLDGRAWADQSA